ncbi:MAG: MlaD family protein [Verrucomicrobiota bacterium]
MKTKLSPSVIGLFVLGALLLAGIGLVSFGNVSLFTKPERFVVYFDESVHGLDLGSPVKFRGVRIGRVADIRVRYDAAKQHSEIEVVCEFSRDTINDAAGGAINIADHAVLKKFVDEGLRAQLGILGFATGLLYVELDFFNARQFPPTRSAFADKTYASVPAVRSKSVELQASIFEVLAKLKDVDIAALAREVTGLVTDVRRQFNALDLPQLVSESTQTVRAVRVIASDPAWQTALANANSAITDLRNVIARMDGQVGPTVENLNAVFTQAKAAVDSFNAAALTVRQFITAQQGLGADADIAVRRLAEAADAVRRLAEFLERNPAALITGSKPAEPGAPVPASPASRSPAGKKP